MKHYNFRDVGDFHRKFGLPSVGFNFPPKSLSPELIKFRIQFMLEEIQEFVEACNMELEGNSEGKLEAFPIRGLESRVDNEQAFDALLDLVYVAMGTAHFLGYPWQAGWDEVQRANMTKVRATSPDQSKRGTSLDVVKPVGWTPPNHRPPLRQSTVPEYTPIEETP